MGRFIEWAPASIPWNRRMETLAAGIWIFLMIFGELVCTVIFIAAVIYGNIHVKFLCVIYVIYICFDQDAADQGGKGSGIYWIRNNFYWTFFRNYFPVNLVKTVDLSSDRNYLFAVYPHGILCCGVFGNFVSCSPEFKKLFPGIRSKVLTLKSHFNIPIWRELLFSWGLASASPQSLKRILFSSNDPKSSNNLDGYTSNAAVVVVGGAQEALFARPENYQIVIKNRKGFVKMAIKTGCPIVPVFSFGEVDIFNQKANPVGSLVRKFQDFVKKQTGIVPTLFFGRGFLQYTFGFVPKRKPITTVVGAPIEVTKMSNPTPEEIEKIHSIFTTKLKELFEQHKSNFISNSNNIELIMN